MIVFGRVIGDRMMFWCKQTTGYLKNESGQVAVITAIAAIPLLLGVSLAIDSHVSDRARVRMQAALDNAAIAAISNQTITVAERTDNAETRFFANMSEGEQVKFRAKSSERRIDVVGSVVVDRLLGGIIGEDTVQINASSAAEVVKGSTVCMLALDPNSNRSFEVTTGAKLQANCAVQVNSVEKQASIVDHGGVASAESFCIGGGAFGEHEPFVNTECATLDDPYKFMKIDTPSEPCKDQAVLDALLQDWRSGRDAVDTHNASQDIQVEQAKEGGYDFVPTYFEKNSLTPGNYCEGLKLNAHELSLDPGVYHITGGELIFGGGSEVGGEDITFVLHDNVSVEIRDGSMLNIKSPTSGPFEGLVIAQSLEDKSITNPTYPNVDSMITNDSTLNLLGTIYLPSHKVNFLGGSESTAHAPATAFIAHQISLSEGANITVSVDHITAGTSPIQPRSDSTVRLVR